LAGAVLLRGEERLLKKPFWAWVGGVGIFSKAGRAAGKRRLSGVMHPVIPNEPNRTNRGIRGGGEEKLD